MSSEQNTEGGLPLRAKKTSLEHLVMNIADKKLIIKAIDKLVLLNSKIAVRGSMIMNYLVAKCIDEGTVLPPINQALLYKAFNWNHQTALSEQFPEIEGRIPNPLTAEDVRIDGKSWLIGYLVVLYMANIKTSIRGKYNSVIKQSIKGYIKAYLPNASKDDISTISFYLKRCICRPRSETEEQYSHLDEDARDLVKFHRDGFGVNDDGYINDIFIDSVLKGQESISRVVMHFAKCLERQQLLEDEFLMVPMC
jgi:hypothetical protein